MAIDNDVYNRAGKTWWDDDNPLVMLHGSVTPGRFDYFRNALTHRLVQNPRGLRALDIGCGGGFLAEEFARLGCDVVGVDPSEVSVDTARRHAQERGLAIEYKVGSGEQLPAEDHGFDIAYCCDVLEHVSDLEKVYAETSRVLKPGGVYFFDTVNRTFASYLLAIKVIQEWRFTRIFDFALHDWSMFIKPAELTAGLSRHGLHVSEIVGLGPQSNPFSILRDLIKVRHGNLSYAQLSTRMNVGKIRSKSISYMGFATKRALRQPR